MLPILPLEPGANSIYALSRTALERAGTSIGANNLLIAAHAKSLGLTLVTDNRHEFDRVQELIVKNWSA